jgi:fumarate reductase subunit D
MRDSDPTPRRSHEPIAWSLFGAGGMLLALVGPGLVLATLVLMPGLDAGGGAGDVYVSLHSGVQHPAAAVAAFVVLSLTFFHTFHRLCHGLADLHVPISHVLAGWLCYGAASGLSLLAGLWLYRI